MTLSKVYQENNGSLVRFTAVQEGRTIGTRWMTETPELRASLPAASEFNIMCYAPIPEEAEFIGNYELRYQPGASAPTNPPKLGDRT